VARLLFMNDRFLLILLLFDRRNLKAKILKRVSLLEFVLLLGILNIFNLSTMFADMRSFRFNRGKKLGLVLSFFCFNFIQRRDGAQW
jgi:hypothetical protein